MTVTKGMHCGTLRASEAKAEAARVFISLALVVRPEGLFDKMTSGALGWSKGRYLKSIPQLGPLPRTSTRYLDESRHNLNEGLIQRCKHPRLLEWDLHQYVNTYAL